MEYNLNKLTSVYIFPISKLLYKIGIKEFKNCFSSETVREMAASGENADSVGLIIALDIAGVIASNLSNCETEIYDLLSSISGLKVEELKQLSIAEFAELIITIVQKEEFKDFFKVVFESLK